MWVPPTPAPAILRACSAKNRQELSCQNQSKTTINYIISGIILPADSNTIHRNVQKCLSQRHGGTEIFFEIFIVGSCNPFLHEPLDKNPDAPTLKPDAYASHTFSVPLCLCESIFYFRTDITHQPGINQAFNRVWCSIWLWFVFLYFPSFKCLCFIFD